MSAFVLSTLLRYYVPMLMTNALENELVTAKAPMSEDEVYIYTEGDCWMLAEALHLRGVGELTILGGHIPEHDWFHMVVRVAEDLYLDVLGLQTEAQLRKRWSWIYNKFELTQIHPKIMERFATKKLFPPLGDEAMLATAVERITEWWEELEYDLS